MTNLLLLYPQVFKTSIGKYEIWSIIQLLNAGKQWFKKLVHIYGKWMVIYHKVVSIKGTNKKDALKSPYFMIEELHEDRY